MNNKSEAMYFSREELKHLANGITCLLGNDNSSFVSLFNLLNKLNEQLDNFTANEM